MWHIGHNKLVTVGQVATGQGMENVSPLINIQIGRMTHFLSATCGITRVPFTMAFQLNKIRACYPGSYQLPELVSPAPGDGAAVVAAHVAPHHVRLVIWWWGYKYFFDNEIHIFRYITLALLSGVSPLSFTRSLRPWANTVMAVSISSTSACTGRGSDVLSGWRMSCRLQGSWAL